MVKTYTTVRHFQSTSKPEKMYTVKQDEHGKLSCNCPSWIFNKYKDRSCYHTKTIEAAKHSVPEPIKVPMQQPVSSLKVVRNMVV